MTKKIPPDFNPDIADDMEMPKIFQIEIKPGASLIIHDNGQAFAEIKLVRIRENRIELLVFHDGAEMDIDTSPRFTRKHPMEPYPSLR